MTSSDAPAGKTRIGVVGVVGAGVMGAGIAQVLAVAGHPVVCYDINDAVLERAKEGIATGAFGLSRAVARGKLSEAAAGQALERVTFSTALQAVAGTDVVIEAVPEDLGLKIRIFRELDAIAAPTTILATNSSGFPVSALAAATSRPDRVIGWHWASPAPAMKLAEIVRAEATSQETVDTICALAAGAGKNPIVVADRPTAWGYVANRIYSAMFQEAERVVREGVATREQVDQLLVDCYRWPAGPFAMTRGAGNGWT